MIKSTNDDLLHLHIPQARWHSPFRARPLHEALCPQRPIHTSYIPSPSALSLEYGVLTNTRTYQLAEVARGIRRSSGMTDSSKFRLLSCPGFSWASRACALQWMSGHVQRKKKRTTHQIVSTFTSPPKYLERSPFRTRSRSANKARYDSKAILTYMSTLFNDGSLHDGFVPPILPRHEKIRWKNSRWRVAFSLSW